VHNPPAFIVAGRSTRLIVKLYPSGHFTKVACHLTHGGRTVDLLFTKTGTEPSEASTFDIFELDLPPLDLTEGDKAFYRLDHLHDGHYNRSDYGPIPVVLQGTEPPPAGNPARP